MTKILITGSHSFVGSNYLKHSNFKEIDEVSLFDYKPGTIDFKKYSVILHLVAIVHQKVTIPDENYYRINCDLTLQVAKEAKAAGVRHFVFMSTVKVYGKYTSESGYWNETSICKPDDAYGRSKYAAEIALKELEDDNFIISIVRTPLVYGDGVRANMLGMVKLVHASRILPFKNIQNRRNFTSAENLVAFIDRIIEKKASGVFIAMDKDAISTTELVLMISEVFGKKLVLFKIPNLLLKIGIKVFPRLFDRLYGSYEMDNTKTLDILEFEPPISTKEGIRRMISSMKEKI